jgi:hypothetical protein
MATVGALTEYAIGVKDNASQALNNVANAADRAGSAVEQLDNRVRRGGATFDDLAAGLDKVERGAQRVERATANVTAKMEAAERAARAEGVAQERLNAVLVSGAQQREAAALQAVRGLTAEQQAAALTRAGYANLAAQVQATAQAQTNLGVRASQGLAAANDNVTASSGRMGVIMGQAGFQVQDFATQVSMGQNALTAFGVQFAQFAGIFGTAGAIAGAAVTLGLIGVQLLGMGESAAEAERKIEVAFNAIKADSEGVREVIKEIGDLYKTAADRAQDLARAQRDVLSQNVDLRLGNAIQMQDAAATRIPQLEREITVLERRAQVEAEIARRASRNGAMLPVDQTTDTTTALFVARSQLNGLRSEMDLQDRRIRDLNEARQRLANAGNDQGFGQYGPEPPRAERARASTERLTDAAREYAQIMRDAETAVTRTLSEEERRANTLDRLSQMLAEGQISGDQYVVAVEAQRRAVAALAEQEQARASERAAAEATRQATRAAEQAERQNQQVTDSIVRYGADRFADMFSENSRGWAGMLDTFRSTARSVFARIAAEAIIRPIIAPVVQGLGLGQVGGIGTGGSTASAGGASSSGGGFSLSSLGSIRTAYDSLSNPGAMGQFFPGGGSVNTSFSGLNNALNTNVFQGAFPSEAGFQAIVDGTGATTGASLGQLLGPAASVAGGAYSVYSGLQRGGPGGYTSALGGAVSAGTGLAMLGSAAGLLPALGALGPIGLGVGAVLAIAGALMPGAKPSGQGQLARTNLNSGLETTQGLGGDRYSAANAGVAGSTVDNIVTLAREIGDKLGGARIGGDVAVGVTNGTIYLDVNGQKTQAANSEQGAKDIASAAAQMVLNEFRGQGVVQGELGGILRASGTVEALSANLDWYERTYKVMTQAAEPVSAFAQSLEQLTAQFAPAIQKAGELGLSVDAMTAARERELTKLREARDAQVTRFDTGLDIRAARLAGNAAGADLLAFNLAAVDEIEQTRKALTDLGLSAEDVAARITRTEETLAAERARIASDSAAAQITSARSVLDWLNGQALGATSSLSPTARLSEAERQFNAALAGGDTRALTSAADALLVNSRDVLGGATEAYAQREAFVRQTVANRGSGEVATVTALSQMTVALQAELAALRQGFADLLAETRRSNNQAMVA